MSRPTTARAPARQRNPASVAGRTKGGQMKKKKAGLKWGRIGAPKSPKRKAWLAKIRKMKKTSRRKKR